MAKSRRMTIARAGIDYFAAGFSFLSVFLTAAALIWDIPPAVVFAVPLGVGAIFSVAGVVESYRTTREEILKAKEDDEKINMVVRELQEKHDLAHSPDFTSQLSSLVASTNNRTVRRRHDITRDHSHLSSSNQHSPATVSRATTIHINADPTMVVDVKKGEQGGVSITAHPKLTDSPSAPAQHRSSPPGTPGTRFRSTPPPIIDTIVDVTDDEKPIPPQRRVTP